MVYLLSDFIGDNQMLTGLVFTAEFMALVAYGHWMVNRSRTRGEADQLMPYLIVDNT